MTANTNQPNRGNAGDASRTGAPGTGTQGQQQQGKQTQGAQAHGRDEGTRFGAGQDASQDRKGGQDTARFLDAIEENVNKLRSAMSGSGRSGGSEERQGRQGSTRDTDKDEDRDATSRDL